MRRSTLAASVVLTCAAAVSSVAGTASAAQTPATAGRLCSTTSTIDLAALGFNPSAVHPGGTSVATATVVNCTGQTQSAAAQWMGRFVSSTGTGFPPGCPVIDPLWLPFTLAPHAVANSSVGYMVPAGCTANGLIVTVEIIQNGKIIAQRSATLVIEQ